MKHYEVLLMRQLIDTVLRNDWIIFVLFLILYNFEDHCMILFEFVLMLPHVKRIYNILFKKLRIELKVLKKKNMNYYVVYKKQYNFFFHYFFHTLTIFEKNANIFYICEYLEKQNWSIVEINFISHFDIITFYLLNCLLER